MTKCIEWKANWILLGIEFFVVAGGTCHCKDCSGWNIVEFAQSDSLHELEAQADFLENNPDKAKGCKWFHVISNKAK